MIEITYQLNYLATPISTPISSRKIDTPGRGVTVRPNALHGPRTRALGGEGWPHFPLGSETWDFSSEI